jgi:biotin synthase-like enzyme
VEKLKEYNEILDKARQTPINREEAVFLLKNAETPEAVAGLFAAASHVRRNEAGDIFRFDGFMGGNTKCTMDPPCLYCRRAIPGHDMEPWSLEPADLSKVLAAFKDTGTSTVEIGGGTNPDDCGRVGAALLEHIKGAGLKAWANFGPALSRDDIMAMRELGIEGITSSFETINPAVFKDLKPGDDLGKRQELAHLISECGVNLFSTMLVGIGESPQDRVDHLFYLKDIPQFYKLSVSWLKVHPGGPLDGKMTGPSPMEPAKVVSVARLIFRDIGIGMSGAQHVQLSILAGANRMVHGGASFHKKGGYRIGAQGFRSFESREVVDGFVMDNLLPITAQWAVEAGMDVEPGVRRANLKAA